MGRGKSYPVNSCHYNMKDFQPLSGQEQQAVMRVVEELEKLPTIPCTNCRYCVEGCPKKIRIPDIVRSSLPMENRLSRFRSVLSMHGMIAAVLLPNRTTNGIT